MRGQMEMCASDYNTFVLYCVESYERVPLRLPRRWVAGEVSRSSIAAASTLPLPQPPAAFRRLDGALLCLLVSGSS